MTRAEICIPRILRHEGGFVNHPSDPGGATNKGITIATFRRYIKPSGTVADLKKLTEAQAVIVYKRQYWDAVNADMLPNGVDYTVADFAVNSGPSRGAKELQRIVGASMDGKVGPATLKAVRAMPSEKIINDLNDRRLRFMRGLKGGRLWETFGRGWQRRVDDVRKHSLADMHKTQPPIQVAPPVEPKGVWAAILALFGALSKGSKS